jgi:hypothetical protein
MRKAAANVVAQTLDPHLKEKKPSDGVVPYSDKAFRELAIEWLISTDQVTCSFPGLVTPFNICATL